LQLVVPKTKYVFENCERDSIAHCPAGCGPEHGLVGVVQAQDFDLEHTSSAEAYLLSLWNGSKNVASAQILHNSP